MTKIRTHLTYANVMSSLAVFMLLGGATAFAAKKNTQKIGTTQIKASAVTTAKIKNGAVDASKLKDGAVNGAKLADGSVSNSKLADGSVSTSKIAGDAVTGDKVNESSLSEVPSANSANPVVFAHVNPGTSGTVDAASSKGITSLNVSRVGVGIYCINVPGFSARGGQATAQASGVTATTANFAFGESCPGAVQVRTFNTGGPADPGFYVQLYR